MTPINVLLMDRDETFIAGAAEALSREGMNIESASFWPDGLRLMSAHLFDVVVLDARMIVEDRAEMLRTVRLKYPLVEIIMATDSSNMDDAVEGLKLGAFDFIVKPWGHDDALEKIMLAADRKRKTEEKIKNARIKRIISHPMAVFEKDVEIEKE